MLAQVGLDLSVRGVHRRRPHFDSAESESSGAVLVQVRVWALCLTNIRTIFPDFPESLC